MLRSMKDLLSYAVSATDGPIGHVTDFFFDDEAWVIRYVAVDTGSWLSSRRILISPNAIDYPHIESNQLGWMEKIFAVSITKQQVQDSPQIDTDKPITRQQEIRHLGHYGYPCYWSAPGTSAGDPDECHLRSCKALARYRIEASDGDIGRVQGLFFDEDNWAIRYLVVDTNNWWLDHPVLIAPQWIQQVRWPDTTVCLNVTRQQVQAAPPYEPATALDRSREIEIHRHYGRVGYWVQEASGMS